MPEPSLPLILAGPILRRMLPDRLCIWVVSSQPVDLSLQLSFGDNEALIIDSGSCAANTRQIVASSRCVFHLMDIPLPVSLPFDTWIEYDMQVRPRTGGPWQAISAIPGMRYGDKPLRFVLHSTVRRVLHGSCRKPHYPGGDGLVRVDQLLGQVNRTEDAPSLLMMSGDQIYADDVAGPMLVAVHRLIKRLDLPGEHFGGDEQALSDKALHGDKASYYARSELLPKTESNRQLLELFFGGAKKPVFTSINAQNHLITLSEVLAMYLLTWSPVCWGLITLDAPDELSRQCAEKYGAEQSIIEEFAAYLPQIRRVLAHLPVAMIFDDHDITDDWNLTAGWERAAYEHDFSRRIIGNALVGYLLCQGWGNAPEQFSSTLLDGLEQSLQCPGSQTHNEFIDILLKFSHWHYQWPTSPALVVLDTRTHRWRSERNMHQPSGLMDWESFAELQQSLLDKETVMLVSAAPMFGVKLIETVQRVFTWFGFPLMVDAENWMAHPGAASTLLNLFCHKRTPKKFIILSGDVHYSFVYRIQLRRRKNSPDIWQITSSGVRNQFPRRLLDVFDRLNRWLYAPWSPLNLFTKRSIMRVTPHAPDNKAVGQRLVNASGIGLLELDDDGTPRHVKELSADGTDIEFILDESQSRWE